MRLDRYVIGEPLGAGGMGEVHRARDETLERDVAIKVMKPELALDPERVRRFEREARAVGRLHHPNVLTVFDVGHHDGAPYVVTELLEGETLRKRLDRGALPLEEAAALGADIAWALDAAHEHGIVHRDLKPENVFLVGGSQVKLLDFGIAKLLPAPMSGSNNGASTLSLETQPGAIVGTAGYMAPEQVLGEAVDHRADLFSLGAILFEMSEGARAFGGGSPVAQLASILKESPPVALANDASPSAAIYREVVRRCLAKDAALRYPTAREVAEELARVSPRPTPEEPAPDGPRAQRSPRGTPPAGRALARWIAGVLSLAAIAFGLGRWSRKAPVETGAQATSAPPVSPPSASPGVAPRFSRLTYQAGGITSARFTPDGHNVVFGALYGGDTLRIHTVRTENPVTLAVDIAGDVLAVSSHGEMAVSLGRRLVPWPAEGTLARAPLLGGAARPLQDDVFDADFESGGEDLIVARRVGEETRIERPLGNVVFRTRGWVSHLRLDPSGTRIAFFLHPFPNDTQGRVAVLEKDGSMRELGDLFLDLNGLAWAPGGREIWFSGASQQGPFEIAAIDLEGRGRLLFQGPGRVVLHDVARDGRALVTVDDWRGISVSVGPKSVERDLSILDNSVVMDVTRDGSQVLVSEQSAGGRPSYDIYLRPTAGGPPTLLGEGLGESISPSGTWVTSVLFGKESAIDIIPIGAGSKRRIQRPGFTFHKAFFLGSDDRLLIVAVEANSERRLYTLDLSSGEAPQPLSPPGPWLETWPRSDGGGALTRKPNGEVWMFSARPGDPARRVTTLPRGHTLVRPVSASAAFVLRRGTRPGELLRLDLATGKLEHQATLGPRDLTGFVEASTFVAAQGPERYAYTYFKLLSTLFVVEGLGPAAPAAGPAPRAAAP